jgi:hypothetical protein
MNLFADGLRFVFSFVSFAAMNPLVRMLVMGRQCQYDPLTSRHSIGLRRRMASAAIETPSWSKRRRAPATGYVSSTLKPAVGAAIPWVPE